VRGFRVVRAATADALAADLAGTFAGPQAPGPLDRCVIAVQGPGLGRWLRTDMARRLGAWGGVETPFLRSFLLDLACAGSPVQQPRGREDIDQLGFRIAAALSATPRGQGAPDGRSLDPVLRMVRGAGGSVDHAALLRVSHRLADAFDRYQVDRPELVMAWEQGRSGLPAHAPARLLQLESWQRPLWQATALDHASHRAWSRLRQVTAQWEQGVKQDHARLPAFVSVFGVSLLSPFLVRVLQALGRHTRVTLHMLAPTQAFVAERSTRRQLLWQAAEAQLDEAEMAEALHMQAGHPLLDAMGRQASQAQRVLLDLDVDLDADLDADQEPPASSPGTALQRLQQDLLLDQPPKGAPDRPDESIQVHSVASPHRAAEVAHDAVLAAMAEMPGLRPERVGILTPDIAVVGNAIESVFARHGRITLTAADRRLARPSSLVVGLQHALRAVGEGLTMSSVQATLGQAGTLAALRLQADELARWMDHLERAGARRFLDAADRAARLERPMVAGDRIHTLQWAVDRVVLGVAMQAGPDPMGGHASPGPTASVDPELLPAAAAGSAALQELHRVVQAVEALADFVRQAREERPLSAWCELLQGLGDRLLPAAEHADFGDERRHLDRGLAELAEAATQGGFPEPIAFGAAREQLMAAMADTREGTHFAGGGVQLARLSPMRSVPFDVLLLVGMDLGVFPRSRHADGLDLVQADPRAGDQVPRHEDLQLFLECVHAARHRLVIIHQGIDARTGGARPPSPVVDQLLDACVAGSAQAEALRKAWMRVHPLRADQPEAWQRADRAGFDAHAWQGAAATARGRVDPVSRSFMDGVSLDPQPPESTHDWLKALRKPAEMLLARLGLRMPDGEALLREGDELIEPDALQNWKRRDSCAQAIFRGVDAEDWLRSMRLQGWLPHGPRGEAMARETLEEVLQARRAVSARAIEQGWLASGVVRTVQRDHRMEVRGRSFMVPVEQLHDRAVQVLWFPAGRRHHRIALWIRHLMWSAADPAGHSIEMPIGNATAHVHAAIDPARAIRRLEWLLDLATAATCVPLPIEPKVVEAWDPDPIRRALAIRKQLETGFDGLPGVMDQAEAALVFAQERWGPGDSVQIGSARVPTGLDELAAEIQRAMQQDGWAT
jgi:exodeoxyribonuclease V gamma subunit